MPKEMSYLAIFSYRDALSLRNNNEDNCEKATCFHSFRISLKQYWILGRLGARFNG